MDPKATPRVQVRERSATPPPANARTLLFEFEVEDTGPGIPDHLQAQVFEPFVQGKRSPQRTGHGFMLIKAA